MNRNFLFLIVATTFASSAFGGDSAKVTKGSVLKRKATRRWKSCYDADRPQITLADLITVELRVEGTANLEVEIPEGAPAGWIFVNPKLPIIKESAGKDRVRWRLITQFAPEQPGPKVSFVYPAVTYRDGKDAHTVKFAPVEFVVTTKFTNPDLSQLRDNANIETLPPVVLPEPMPWTWIALGGAVIVLMALAIGARRYWRRTSRPGAAQLALQEWQRLVALGLPEKGHSERFVTLLTLLVRQYLERQFSVRDAARRRNSCINCTNLDAVTGRKQFLTALERSEHVAASADDAGRMHALGGQHAGSLEPKIKK